MSSVLTHQGMLYEAYLKEKKILLPVYMIRYSLKHKYSRSLSLIKNALIQVLLSVEPKLY